MRRILLPLGREVELGCSALVVKIHYVGNKHLMSTGRDLRILEKKHWGMKMSLLDVSGSIEFEGRVRSPG